jgi:RND superfamily putative drug exporter
MFDLLGRLAVDHPWKVCAVWLVAAAALTLAAPAWQAYSRDDDIHFLPAECPSVRGYELLAQAFPNEVYGSRLVVALERAQPLTAEDFTLVDRLTAELEQLGTLEPELGLGAIRSCRDPVIGRRLTSGDGCCTLITAALEAPYLALATQAAADRAESRLRQVLAQAGGDPPRMYVTGSAGIGRDLLRATRQSLDRTTAATIGLVILILVLLYRAPLLALAPLATIGLSAWVALKVLALVAQLPGVHLATVSQVFVIVLLFGAGTDYCIFLIGRYREELRAGQEIGPALQTSVGRVGLALAASAGTVICGLSLMALADFAKVRCAGPAIALGLLVAVAATLTLTPALLRLMGAAAFWPHEPGAKPAAPRLPFRLQQAAAPPGRAERFWDRLATRVMTRPRTVLAASALVLVPLALAGLVVTADYKATGQLSDSAESRQGGTAIQRHFTAGETGPISVLLVSPADWDTPAGHELIDHLSRGFCQLGNVAEVRSLTQPLGERQPLEPPAPRRGLLGSFFGSLPGNVADALRRQSARQHYLSRIDTDDGVRHVARIDVITESDPFDRASFETLGLIETWVNRELPRFSAAAREIRGECYGIGVHTRDMARVVEADRLRINWLVLAGIALILLGVLRRPWLVGYLLLTVLVSYYATVGMTALAGSLWVGQLDWQLDWRILFFLFTLLMAVGQDYNILLVTRMMQEQAEYGVVEGIRRGLARTGGVITACGLIMAGTFATLMLTSLGTLVQTGFALTFGVLLDTFVIRPFVVPAFLRLWWKEGEAVSACYRRPTLDTILRQNLGKRPAAA